MQKLEEAVDDSISHYICLEGLYLPTNFESNELATYLGFTLRGSDFRQIKVVCTRDKKYQLHMEQQLI